MENSEQFPLHFALQIVPMDCTFWFGIWPNTNWAIDEQQQQIEEEDE